MWHRLQILLFHSHYLVSERGEEEVDCDGPSQEELAVQASPLINILVAAVDKPQKDFPLLMLLSLMIQD